MSASRSRRQVIFGLPLFLLPWGFYVRTCLVMFVIGFLNVWPSHPHLLLRISISIWAWCVLSQRSLLLTLSIQCIRRILRRQWLTNVWILIRVILFPFPLSTSTRTLRVCQTSVFFVVSPINFDFHTFLNSWKATLGLLILFFMSASVPPCVSTMLSRYLKSLSSSSVSPSRMIGVSQLTFVLRIFVFLLLIINPTCAEITASSVVLACICLWL